MAMNAIDALIEETVREFVDGTESSVPSRGRQAPGTTSCTDLIRGDTPTEPLTCALAAEACQAEIDRLTFEIEVLKADKARLMARSRPRHLVRYKCIIGSEGTVVASEDPSFGRP